MAKKKKKNKKKKKQLLRSPQKIDLTETTDETPQRRKNDPEVKPTPMKEKETEDQTSLIEKSGEVVEQHAELAKSDQLTEVHEPSEKVQLMEEQNLPSNTENTKMAILSQDEIQNVQTEIQQESQDFVSSDETMTEDITHLDPITAKDNQQNAEMEASDEIKPMIPHEMEQNKIATAEIAATNELEKTRSEKHKKKKKKRKWIIGSLIAVLLLALAVVAYVGNQFMEAIALGHYQIGKSKLRQNNIEIDKTPFTVLLLGTDQRGANSKNWRPDVIMVAAVNPKTKSIKLVSLPRDLKVRIATGEIDKLNHSSHMGYKHNIDPVQNIRQTIENFLNIPIDYYAKINFQGFTDVVDALGGVDVVVKKPFSQQMIGGEWAYFKPGPAHLDGAHALAYVRMRKQDPLGDMSRNSRQREVITQLMDKLVSTNAVLKFNDIMKAVGGNFNHNFNTSDIAQLAKIYQLCKGNIQRYEFRSEGTWINGGWYELWSNNERSKVSHMLQKQLEYQPAKALEPSPLNEWEEQFAAQHDNDQESVYEENEKTEKDSGIQSPSESNPLSNNHASSDYQNEE
ncbi:LCP family protein [Thermoflavimicrobium dichotomicum]|uniref:Cell envelope-related function transcriptional attenuator common domain-containing protein n=1 Tax=Thermoflavimicrobium dichotomicum TaxID=46223 RepID=A0A1I3JY33_9BACL|nr:LCP family protein [Thermoflavimicrobium dichotomicum]SFI65177.1 cell envelope-related function transcriptional attenuator common domain-containing protein [Thermoflavimicrobium dichotomicum]